MKVCRRGHRREDDGTCCWVCKKASRKEWKARNRDKDRASGRKHYWANRERRIANTERWRQLNKERHRRVSNQWIAAHLEAYTLSRRRGYSNRRARKLAATIEPFTSAQWQAVVDSYYGICAYCSQAKWEHQDHVIPLSRGGSHSISNLVPACADCNRRKAAKTWLPGEPYLPFQRAARRLSPEW